MIDFVEGWNQKLEDVLSRLKVGLGVDAYNEDGFCGICGTIWDDKYAPDCAVTQARARLVTAGGNGPVIH